MDREKVIKALQTCSVQNDAGCQGCPYFEERKTYGHEWCTTSMAQDALALLKEDCHNCKLECLLQKYDELKEKYDALLKEQEAVEPIITPWAYDEDGNIAVAKKECGKCGCQFFTERPNFCENCGTPILWESRIEIS